MHCGLLSFDQNLAGIVEEVWQDVTYSRNEGPTVGGNSGPSFALAGVGVREECISVRTGISRI